MQENNSDCSKVVHELKLLKEDQPDQSKRQLDHFYQVVPHVISWTLGPRIPYVPFPGH